MRDFAKDLWTTLRSLARRPALTIVVVLTLGLGIGASTTLYAYLTSILSPPLDAPHPERVYWVEVGTREAPHQPSSAAEYRDLKVHQHAVGDLAAFTLFGASVGHGRDTAFAWGNIVDGGYFSLFAARPALGRLLQPSDDRPGAEPVVVASHFFWQGVLGGDPAAVGRPLRINGRGFMLVGVTREGFRGFGASAALFVPLAQADRVTGVPRLDDPEARWLSLAGRLAPGAGPEQARAALALAGKYLDSAWPMREGRREISISPAAGYTPNEEADRYLTAARILLAAAALFLALACANVANLLLARATARQREWGVRAALGATRRRLLVGTLAESLFLGLAGGGAGIAIALLLARRMETYLNTSLGGLGSFTAGTEQLPLDARAFAFGLVAALACGLLCGAAPMLHVLRGDLLAPVKADSGGTASRSGGLALRRLLVVVQVALSALLLLGGSLLVRSLRNAERTDPGFDARGLLYATLYVPRSGADPSAGQAYPRIQENAARLPGVRGATLVQIPPLAGWSRTTRVAGHERPDRWRDAAMNIVGAGYFETVGVPIVRGRALDERDRADSAAAVVVNESLARALWGDADPVGRYLVNGEAKRPGELGPDFQVVGVAKDVRMTSVTQPPEPAVYYSYDQHKHSRMTLVVRAAVPPETLLPALRSAARSAHPDLAFVDVTTSEEQLRRSLVSQRMYAEIAGLLGLLGLAVAVIGLFGLLSYTVSLRVREFGIRMAVGAQSDDVLRLVLRQGLGLVAAGIAIGLLGSLALTRLLRTVLFGVAADDPATFALVAALLTFVALFACYLPAQRASQLDPLAALRETV